MNKLPVFITNAHSIETMQTAVPHAVISIRSHSQEGVRQPDDPFRVATLFVAFDDCSFADRDSRDPMATRPITKKEARRIWNFFEHVLPDIKLLVVQCEAGISRSSAVAASLLEGSGFDSSACYKPPKVPNPYVKLVMMRVRRDMLNAVK
jgi:predicted protein tyrosine phosphatase